MAEGKRSINPILGWLILGILFAWLLGLYLAARDGNIPVLFAGLVIMAGVFWYFARRGRTYYENHPEEAAQAKRQRAVMMAEQGHQADRNFKQKVVSVGIALAVVLGASLFRRYAPGFAALPKSDQRLYLVLGGIALVVLCNLAWMAWKKRRASA
jgi:hypothetical protein